MKVCFLDDVGRAHCFPCKTSLSFTSCLSYSLRWGIFLDEGKGRVFRSV